MDSKYLEPGHVAIDNLQSLKFARSLFSRGLLSVSKPGDKVFICHRFLVPRCTNVIIAPNNTVRYAKYALFVCYITLDYLLQLPLLVFCLSGVCKHDFCKTLSYFSITCCVSWFLSHYLISLISLAKHIFRPIMDN